MKITKGITWPLWTLALLTTLVFMAGLAALQNGCGAVDGPFNSAVQPGVAAPNAAFGMSDGFNNCHKWLRFYWFTFAFVIVTLIGLAIAAATHLGLHYSRPFWVGMLSICILLMMIASEAFLGFDKLVAGSGSPGWWISRSRLTTAGAIMSVISLIGLLLAVGTDWERAGSGHRRRDDKVTGTTTVTTEQAYAGPVQGVRVVDQV